MNKSLIDHPRLGDWIDVGDDGAIIVRTGKVELGQGLLTALAQIAARGLCVRLTRIKMRSGDTDATPNEGYTAGSMSIETSGAAIRAAAAQLRVLLLEGAAIALGCAIAELAIDDGEIVRNGRASGLDFWMLATRIDFDRPITDRDLGARPVLDDVGATAQREDLPIKLSGRGFLHDLVFDGMQHARVLRAPRWGARLVSIDEAKVAGNDSVRCIRNGDIFAVVAENEGIAIKALARAQRVAIWEGGKAVDDDAGAPHWLMAQPSQERISEIGAPALTNLQTTTIEATFGRPFLAHASIGPSCALARYADGRLTVWTHSQGVFPLRASIAKALHFDPSAIRVIHRQGAGCYGHNGADDAAFDAAFIAVQCPDAHIRVLWSREDEMSAAPIGAAMATRICATVDASGRPLEWTTEIWSGPHARRPGMNGGVHLLGAEALPDAASPPPPADLPDAVGGGATRNGLALYDLPHQRLIHRMIPDQPVRTSSLRALGAFTNVFAIEGFMDELADASGRDPVEYRLSLLSDPRARRVIETAAAMSDWDPRQASGLGRAKGIGFARYKNRGAYCAVVIDLELDEEIKLRNAWCAVDAGFIVNADGARNQIEGGIIQSASWTLKEAVRFADGEIASRDFDSYPMLRFSDIPLIDVRLIGASDEQSVGVGEAAAGPVAGAIGNAASRALGARLRQLPLSRDRILAALL